MNILMSVHGLVRGAAMELGKRDAFQVRPFYDGENYMLRFLKGNDLFNDWLDQQKTRVKNAPVNFVSVMEKMVDNFSLPVQTRNKAINYATVGKMLTSVTTKLVNDVLDDPEMKLPNYSRAELLRITSIEANNALSEEE